MCLYSPTSKPFIAKKDLVVYKKLLFDGTNGYITPFMKVPVSLNSMQYANDDVITVTTESETAVYEGFIHSYTYYFVHGNNMLADTVTAEAIIPKGTPYYIDNDFSEICSRKLFITDKIYRNEDRYYEPGSVLYLRMHDIFSPFFETVNKKKLVRGWLLCSDNCLRHPLQIPKGLTVKGMYCSSGLWTYGDDRREIFVRMTDGHYVRVFCVESKPTLYEKLLGRKKYEVIV